MAVLENSERMTTLSLMRFKAEVFEGRTAFYSRSEEHTSELQSHA